MCTEATSQDTRNVTGSPVSAAGPTLFNLQAGRSTGKSGPAVAPVNRSRRPENAKEPTTPATSGRSSTDSSPSESLQQCLESRLRARLGVTGSPEYVLRWKHWDMNSGVPICALRASARRISDKDYSGWPTPQVGDIKPEKAETRAIRNARLKSEGKSKGCGGLPLVTVVTLAGYPTCRANDAEKRGQVSDNPSNGLPGMAILAGYATPAARDYKSEKATDEFNAKRWSHPRGKPLSAQVTLVGYPTPAVQNAEGGKNPKGNNGNYFTLQTAAGLVGYPTPLTSDARGSAGVGKQELPNIAALGPGTTSKSSGSETASAGVLNPELSRWLQGFPAGWDCFEDTETPLFQN